jgi:peptidyl-prolyl cis-trans isomerase SurA
MKKTHALILLALFTVSSFAQNNDPVVLTIDKEDFHASEFQYIYSKNNPNPSYQKDSLDQYMELFINYKLKVHEAKALGYDTVPQLKRELAQYRKPLSLPYMTDTVKNEALIKEAYDRIKTEVRASHILIRVEPNAMPADTNAAYAKAMNLRIRIMNGEDFESVATGKGGSEDPSVKDNGGDLGYFTAMQMIYPFENAAFNLNIGEVSMPVRTQYGYHLIKTTDKREAKGVIETAHILLMANPNTSKETALKAKEKIEEIYELLEAGESFEELARKYSEDQSSKAKGGLLPVFGAGTKQRMVPAFEEAAFALENDGDYSKPFKSMFGYHIVLRKKLYPVPTFKQMHNELKVRVERDMRAESTRESFVEDLKKEYGYSDNAQKLLPIFYNSMGDDIYLAKWKGLEDKSHADDILFSFSDQAFTIQDFEDYIVAKQKRMPRQNLKVYVEEAFKRMVHDEIIAFEDSKLEEKYPAFKAIIREYSDGILVFEIMQNEVWKKASKDTAGIKAYFMAHKDDFTYPIRYNGALFACKDASTAKAAYKLSKKGKLSPLEIKEQLNKDSQLNVDVFTQTFNSVTNTAFRVDGEIKTFKEGVNKPYENNDLYYVFNVAEKLPARQREFDEAKGLVTAAYQKQLEEDWLNSLKKKYTITVNKENLYNLGSN